MTVRPFENRDLPGLLDLLKTQDERASQRSMTPESRSIEELTLELGELSPYTEMVPLVLEEGGRIAAYVALCNYEGEVFLEGPLLHPELHPDIGPLLERVIGEAKVRGYNFLEAFIDEENRHARDALAKSSFEPFHTTYIYEFRRGTSLKPLSPSRLRFEVSNDVEVGLYRDLYRETSDNWATRLAWRDEDLLERFADPDVSLTVVYEDGAPVAHLELERLPDEGYAEIAYFGVLPAARGKKLSRDLLLRALHDVLQDEAVELVLARAHDDERAASFALEAVGFRLSHGVVSYTLELA